MGILGMSAVNLVRWGGIAAMVAGLMYVLLALLDPQRAVGVVFSPDPPASVVSIVSVALVGQWLVR